MLGIIEDICKDFDHQCTQDLLLINLDQSKLIICEVNIERERHSANPTQSDKYKNGGFLHIVAQVISWLNFDNTPTFVCGSSTTPNPGCSVSYRFGTSGRGSSRFGTSGHFVLVNNSVVLISCIIMVISNMMIISNILLIIFGWMILTQSGTIVFMV